MARVKNFLQSKFQFRLDKHKLFLKLIRNDWRICLAVSLCILVGLFVFQPITNKTDTQYICSAISQALAAILALVFTITLVAAQMTRRYTAMDKLIFKKETFFLMVLFAIGIIAPLIFLKSDFWSIGVNISLAIATLCVTSLIPFLRMINAILKYDIGIDNLEEEASESIDSKHWATTLNKIQELRKIGLDAIAEARENETIRIEFALKNIGLRSVEEKVIESTLGALSEIGKKAAINRLDGKKATELGFKSDAVLGSATYYALEYLSEVGTKACELSMEWEAFGSIGGLKEICIESIKNNLSAYTIKKGVESLGQIGKETIIRKLHFFSSPIILTIIEYLVEIGDKLKQRELQSYICRTFWFLGGCTVKNSPEIIAHMVLKIKELEKQKYWVRDSLSVEFEKAREQWKDLGDSISQFKKFYEIS
jgi:hypothetical protein